MFEQRVLDPALPGIAAKHVFHLGELRVQDLPLAHRVLRRGAGGAVIARHILGLLAHGARLHIGFAIFRKNRLAAKYARAAAIFGKDRNAGVEIGGDPLALLFRGGVEQPHQQKKRHHRGYEIRIGHLPCTTMVATGDDLFTFYNDGAHIVPRFPSHIGPH